jgi:hypothetical protein
MGWNWLTYSKFFGRPKTHGSSRGKRSRPRPRWCLQVEALEKRELLASTLTGTGFQDFNANGRFDTTATVANAGTGTVGLAIDRGLAGVTVTAFDAGNAVVGTATTTANGTYTLNAGGSGPYRLEFTTLPAGFVPGPQGPDSGTTVQFAAAGATGPFSLGLVQPNQYTPGDPVLATSSYLWGDATKGPNASAPVLVSIPYSAGTQDSDTTLADYRLNPAGNALAVPDSQVGSVWGLAFNPLSQQLYAAAFMKKHAGFGPGGTGAIYVMNPTGTTASVYVDLNAIFGVNTAGANPHDTSGAGSPNGYFLDNGDTSFNAVGKVALGGIAVSDDGKHLYAMDLANRTLYDIPLDRTPTAANIRSVAIPEATVPNATPVGVGSDVRPFAVQFHQGKIYVGLVNSAESTQNANDLRAYVYTVDPTTLAFSAAPALGFSLKYARGQGYLGETAADWLPWTATWKELPNAANKYHESYPQPMLTGIAFDADGNMVLGIRDRYGDQTGNYINDDPATPTDFNYRAVGPGDTLRAFINTPGDLTSGWTLENNSKGPLAGEGPTGGLGNNHGPGGGQFYYQGNLPGSHDQLGGGGVLQLAGFPDVVVTSQDPSRSAPDVRSGGVRWFNDTTGKNDKAYELYPGTPAGNDTTTFGKANGVGALVAFTPTAPVEIGNRVWQDTNGDGIQDGNEPGLAGVTMHLVAPDGTTVLATAVTDASGDYYFSSAAGTSTKSVIFGLSGLTPNTTGYTVRLDNPADFGSTGPLAGLIATRANVGSDPAVDSNGVLVSGIDQATVNTGGPGFVDHTIDFGFTTPAGLSGFVYVDANKDGTKDSGDGAVSAVTITLKDGAGTTVATTQTAADGSYQFTGLLPGTYAVFEAATPAYAEGTNNVGTVNGTSSGNTGPQPDELSNIPLSAGTTGVNYNFGEVGATLSGFVYLDVNANGIKDAGDGALAAVRLTLKDGSGATVATTTTAADGSYQFAGLAAGTYAVFEAATPAYVEGTNNVGTVNGTSSGGTGPQPDELSGIQLNASSTGVNYNFGEVGASVSGFVYVDVNANGVKDAGDGALAGVTLTLKDGSGTTVATTTSAADGSYSFAGLAAGTYAVIEAATPAYAEGTNNVGTVGATPSGSTGPQPDELSSIQLNAGSTGVNYNFGEVGATLSGFVYLDVNANGVKDAGDGALAGVALTLQDSAGTTVATTQTAADGSYTFGGLAAGTYAVFEAATPAYVEGTNNVGTVGGTSSGSTGPQPDELSGIQLSAGSTGVNYDFGEVGATLSGFVYVDVNANGIKDAGDGALAGVALTLQDSAGATVATTQTAADGSYAFAGLAAGTYAVVEAATPAYGEGTNNVGTVSGTNSGSTGPQPDELSGIHLSAASTGVNYNFGEVGATLSGFVYVDVNANGIKDAGDGALAGVTLTLKDGSGTTLATTTTAGDGSYTFAGLAAGTYAVFEAATPAYAEGANNVGTVGGTSSGTAPAGKDEIDAVQLGAGQAGVNYNFGEVGATLSGFVYVDVNANGVKDGGDGALAGVALTLQDSAGTTVATTQTAADGSYTFAGLAAGTYAVFEAATPAYAEGTNNVGTVGGTNSGSTGPQPDELSSIQLSAGSTGVNYDFGEVGATLSGFVYVDVNANGVKDAGDGALAGVTLTLKDGSGATVATTSTAADGSYSFAGLAAGTYAVLEAATPAYAEGTNNGGTVVGTSSGTAPAGKDEIDAVQLGAGQAGVNYNFGEVGATLSGSVYLDVNANGIKDAGDGALAGVTITLKDGSGTTVATMPTAKDGSYTFAGLAAGAYAVFEAATPAYAEGTNNVGTVDGTSGGSVGPQSDELSGIQLNAGSTATGYNFGELLAGLSGYVYVDANGNGIKDAGDRALAGVTLTLKDGSGSTLATTTTAADGSYHFPGLAAGTYFVFEAATPAYAEGTNNVGTVNGTNSGTAPAGKDEIDAIQLGAGQAGVNYNFGEVGATLSGSVYVDVNADGVKDGGDGELAGVAITLKDGAGNTLATTQTAPDGSYRFTGLAAGTYALVEAATPGYGEGRNNVGTVNGTASGIALAGKDEFDAVQLGAGQSGMNYDFGETVPATTTPPPPTTPAQPAPGNISGIVFFDTNGNGVRNRRERPARGVLVTLKGTDVEGNHILLTQRTGVDGSYRFTGLLTGTYTLTVTPPRGYAVDGGQASMTVNPAGTTHARDIGLRRHAVGKIRFLASTVKSLLGRAFRGRHHGS